MKKNIIIGLASVLIVFVLYFFDFLKIGLEKPVGALLIMSTIMTFFNKKKIAFILVVILNWLLVLIYFTVYKFPQLRDTFRFIV